MASTNILFYPKFGYFFNANRELVLTDITGDESNWNPNGWGSNPIVPNGNPPKQSVTSFELNILCYTEGTLFVYTPTSSGTPIDLFGTGFPNTNQYHTINISDVSYQTSFGPSPVTEQVNEFKAGFYLLTWTISGESQIGPDFVYWNNANDIGYSNRFGAFNLNGTCLPESWRQAAFTKGCKPNKKAEQMLRMQKIMYDYWNYNSVNGTVADLADYRFEKTSDVFQAMQDICNDKKNCQC